MRLSNKNFFKNMINELEQVQTETRKKLDIARDKYTRGIITEKGFDEETQRIKEQTMNNQLTDLKTSVNSRVRVEIDALTIEESQATRKKVNSLDYQQSLLNTIQLLPFMAEVNETELKERLSCFVDDSVAISALKKAISNNSNLSYEERLRLAAAMPTDSRGQRQATLEKLRDSFLRQIDEVYNGFSTPIPAKGFDSMLSYVEACDDTCTVFNGFTEGSGNESE